MGYAPIPPPPSITRIEHLKRLYVRGRIDVETLEEYAGRLLKAGVAYEAYEPVLVAPPKPGATSV